MCPSASERELSTDLQARPEQPRDSTGHTFVVEVIDGPDAGARLDLTSSDPSRVLIGTSPVCELRLTDRLVSRRHSALEPTGEFLRLTDLSSTNGTRIGGLLIREVFLRGDEVVSIGGTALRTRRIGGTVRASVSPAMRFGRVIGASLEMRRLYPICERL